MKEDENFQFPNTPISSISSGYNQTIIITKEIDGQSRFKSFTAYHQGEMPIFFLSYKSNVQVNSIPFKLSLLCKNSDQNWNDLIVNIEPYSGGNMAFIVISKILSTKNQLLCQLSNRFTQIINSNNIYSDITITCL